MSLTVPAPLRRAARRRSQDSGSHWRHVPTPEHLGHNSERLQNIDLAAPQPHEAPSDISFSSSMTTRPLRGTPSPGRRRTKPADAPYRSSHGRCYAESTRGQMIQERADDCR
jgi:hypothetical protein